MTTIINRMQNFGVVEYLEWIRQVLGQSVYNQIMQLSPNILNFEKVITLKEQYLYGSKRLGVRKPHLQLAAAPHTAVGYQTPNEPQAPGGWFNNDCMCYTYEEPVPVGGTPPPPANTTFTARFYTHTLGKKEYELTNHLGNVLATVLDRKTGVKASPTATTYAWFKADVSTAQDYYPFGSLMPGRTYVAPAGAGYRFGFNGMQRDDEIKGPGNSLDFGARMYDSRLGRWMSVDPLASKFADVGSYTFVKNNPIIFIDPDGKENIIYLVYLPSSSSAISLSDAKAIADQANKNFQNLGLKTQVVVVDQSNGKNKRFDPCSIDKTDAVAVLGSKEEVIKWIHNNDQKFANELESDWDGGKYNPENSQNNGRDITGKYIAIDASGIKGFGQEVLNGVDPIKTGALLINHGAGHNASINHAYDESNRQSYSVIMSDANRLHNLLANPESGFPTYQDIVNNKPDALGAPRNNDYVERMKQRFGTNEAKPSYKPQ